MLVSKVPTAQYALSILYTNVFDENITKHLYNNSRNGGYAGNVFLNIHQEMCAKQYIKHLNNSCQVKTSHMTLAVR